MRLALILGVRNALGARKRMRMRVMRTWQWKRIVMRNED
jgi:hypothetical protein